MQSINSKKEFDELITNNNYVVVKFYADWCGPCKMLSPVYKEVSEELKDMKLVEVNVDNNQDIATQYNVQSIPTIIFIRDGKEVGKAMGFMAKDALIEKIKSY